MDLSQITSLLADEAGLDVEQAEQAAAVLEARDLLRVGDRRRWRVTVDDPDAAAAYTFDVDAHTARAACIEGARRAIRADPNGCITTLQRDGLTDAQRAQLADDGPDGLVHAVSLWATAREVVHAA